MSEGNRRFILMLAPTVGLTLCLVSTAALSQNLASTLGQVEYQSNCQTCHGPAGEGDGPMADQLTVKPSDLTQISKNNNGYFPFARVYDIIDGRESVRAHGGSDMPVWGNAYAASVSTMAGAEDPRGANVEAAIAGRILSLVYYLGSIQKQ